MNEEKLIHINGIREDLYQAMQIGNIILKPEHSKELYDFMNYQDKEIERLNNIINELENIIDIEMNKMGYAKYDSCLVLMKMKIKELKENNNGIWVNSLLEVIKENNIEFGSDKE